jgi:Protein of unknown function (DUF3500)
MRRLNSARVAMAVAVLAAGAFGSLIASQRTASSMAKSATAWLDSLTPEQRQKAAMPLDSTDRTHWNFIPTSMFPRNGLPIKEMTEPQRKLAHELLKSALSQRGYTITTTIMSELEAILRDTEAAARAAKPAPPAGGDPAAGGAGGGAGRGGGGQPIVRDPELYFFSVFGTPGQKGAWAWRVEGHHVSLHFTIADGRAVVAAPTFFGSNPAEVREGPKQGLRALDREQDAGRALVMSLDDAQKKAAILADAAPNDILTKTEVVVSPLSPMGLVASAMTPKQRDLLMQLIDVYTSEMTADIAAERMAEIKKAGLDMIGFAWAGPVEPGQRHYYRVQGPTFLVEFDNTQNNGNHIHSVWRDFDSDFGRDLLREHLSAVKH